MRALLSILVLFGCGKSNAPSGSGSATGGRSTPPSADAAVVAPAAKLLFDDKDNTPELKIAFDNHVPELPALSSDGVWIARYDSDSGGMPMFPNPVFVTVERLDGSGKPERFDLVDLKMAEASNNVGWDEKPPSAQIAKQVRDRGKAAMARVRDFGSLLEVKVDVTSNGDPKPVKIGDVVFASVENQNTGKLDLTLSDASGKSLHHVRLSPFGVDHPPWFTGGTCGNRPGVSQVYTDQAKQQLYVFIIYHHNEECTSPIRGVVIWPLSKDAPTGDREAIGELLANQFDIYSDSGPKPDALFTSDAQLLYAGDVAARDAIPFHAKAAAEVYSGHDDDDVDVMLSRDGKSAWGSTTTKLSLAKRDDPWRASSVFVKTPAGWRIAATTWSRPFPNAKANADAKAGTLKTHAGLAGDTGDAAVRTAFTKLVTDGVDADAAANGNLVAIGSADGERTVGGKTFATGWNAAWKGRVTVVSSIARIAPSGTTAWIEANVELAKTGYKIPFQLFCVFDKTAAGAWSLVHVHFSI